MSSLIRAVVFTTSLTLLVGSLVGCTCNRASEERRAELKAKKIQAISRSKMVKKRGPWKGKVGKRRGKANIARTDVGVWLIDEKKYAAGEDPWVKVNRKVGAHRPAKNALWVMFKGATEEERAQGLTFISNHTDGFQGFKLQGDTVTLQLRGECKNEGGTLTVYDHILKTLGEFPEIKNVKVLGPDGTTAKPEGEGSSRPACLEP